MRNILEFKLISLLKYNIEDVVYLKKTKIKRNETPLRKRRETKPWKLKQPHITSTPE